MVKTNKTNRNSKTSKTSKGNKGNKGSKSPGDQPIKEGCSYCLGDDHVKGFMACPRCGKAYGRCCVTFIKECMGCGQGFCLCCGGWTQEGRLLCGPCGGPLPGDPCPEPSPPTGPACGPCLLDCSQCGLTFCQNRQGNLCEGRPVCRDCCHTHLPGGKTRCFYMLPGAPDCEGQTRPSAGLRPVQMP
jgi:hypothetical protein